MCVGAARGGGIKKAGPLALGKVAQASRGAMGVLAPPPSFSCLRWGVDNGWRRAPMVATLRPRNFSPFSRHLPGLCGNIPRGTKHQHGPSAVNHLPWWQMGWCYLPHRYPFLSNKQIPTREKTDFPGIFPRDIAQGFSGASARGPQDSFFGGAFLG